MGFMTLTFKQNIRSRKVAEKRFHSFATHVLPQLADEYIAVPERQERGAIHYHLAAAFKSDIRSGFNVEAASAANLLKKEGYRGGKWAPGYKARFDELERKCFASANPALKRIWKVIRDANERTGKSTRKSSPGFGRCETFPVLSNADAIAFYIGTYITSQTERRAPEDKGMRSVRYSLKIRRHHQSFQFACGGNAKWRAGCGALGALLGIRYEDCKAKFGPRWPHRLAPWVFVCYDHLDECKAFAATLPTDMVWRDRLWAVRLFLLELEEKP